jgi:pectin methylesterase-like acyl-CoA thioesterase
VPYTVTYAVSGPFQYFFAVENPMKICSRTKAVLRAFLFVVAVGIFTTAANAATVAVGNCEPGLPKYSTIQIAVDSVPPNSTIKVCPGTYPEQVTISKSLTLSGDSTGNNDAAIVTPPAGGFKANATEFGGSFPSAAQILVAGYSNGSPVSPSPVVKIKHHRGCRE